MRLRFVILATVLAGISLPAQAQNHDVPVTAIGSQEIVVTGTRRSLDNYDAQTPSVGLKRVADFAIQPVTVTGDTRDPDARHQEMYDTIRRAIELAGSNGVQLAFGDVVVEPLTLANYRDLTFSKDNRPDTDRVELMVKSSLAGVNAHEATGRIDRFLKAVKPVGRALMEATDDLTLSVVAPDQYRADIGRIIAEDGAAMGRNSVPIMRSRSAVSTDPSNGRARASRKSFSTYRMNC
jgi:hypothetical protein